MNPLKALVSVVLLLAVMPIQAETCELTISANDMIKYDKSVLSAGPDCDAVTVTLHHNGSLNVNQMGHNWVLSSSAHWKEIAIDSLQAGQENDYLKPNDERVIANTSLIGGGESTSVTFDLDGLDRNQEYTFFCSFPGHYLMMNGSFELAADS